MPVYPSLFYNSIESLVPCPQTAGELRFSFVLAMYVLTSTLYVSKPGAERPEESDRR